MPEADESMNIVCEGGIKIPPIAEILGIPKEEKDDTDGE